MVNRMKNSVVSDATVASMISETTENGFTTVTEIFYNFTNGANIPISTKNHFSWFDFTIFIVMLSFSIGIGIYFGCFGKKQSTKDYLLAGGNMKVIPVVISLVASHTSGLTLLALPAEVYSFGANYCLCVISLILVSTVTVYVFLPVFYKLQLTSTYEYLGIRFDRRIRKFSSVLFTLSIFLHAPIVTYIPSLAFSSATGLDKHIIIPIVCGICVFYTAIGGLKALVWSDTFLFSCTTGGLITILILGVNKAGGLSRVLELAYNTDRMVTFNLANLDLQQRDSFWTIIIGFTVYWIALMSINQSCTQRFLAVPTLKQSKIVVFVYLCVGMAAIKTLGTLNGLTLYANYATCDPVRSHQIGHNNELMPFFTLDVGKKIPGLSGLFIAGVFCASLSTLSSNLNSLSGTIYEDFLKGYLSEKRQQNPGMYLKILVVVIGLITTSMVYTVEHFGGLLSLSIQMNSVAQGPLLGLFILGFLFPRATANGAFYGALVSISFMIFLVVGSNYLKSLHILTTVHKTTSVEGCYNTLNSTFRDTLTASVNTSSIPVGSSHISPYLWIFSISFYWLCLLGTIICVVIGLIISYLSKENSPPVARELLSPIIYKFIDKDKYIDRMDLDYESVNQSYYEVDNSILERRPSKWEQMKEERLRKGSYISDVIEC